jgi:hypothetical protein
MTTSLSSVQGLASSIQWQDLITAIMAQEKARMLDPVTNAITAAKSGVTAWTSFQDLVKTLNTSAVALRDGAVGAVLATGGTTAGGRGLFLATPAIGATPGTYQAEVLVDGARLEDGHCPDGERLDRARTDGRLLRERKAYRCCRNRHVVDDSRQHQCGEHREHWHGCAGDNHQRIGRCPPHPRAAVHRRVWNRAGRRHNARPPSARARRRHRELSGGGDAILSVPRFDHGGRHPAWRDRAPCRDNDHRRQHVDLSRSVD